MATAVMTDIELNYFDNVLFSIVHKIKKNHKRADITSIYKELLNIDNFNTISLSFLETHIESFVKENKIIRKINRNKESYSIYVMIAENVQISEIPSFTLNIACSPSPS